MNEEDRKYIKTNPVSAIFHDSFWNLYDNAFKLIALNFAWGLLSYLFIYGFMQSVGFLAVLLAPKITQTGLGKVWLLLFPYLLIGMPMVSSNPFTAAFFELENDRIIHELDFEWKSWFKAFLNRLGMSLAVSIITWIVGAGIMLNILFLQTVVVTFGRFLWVVYFGLLIWFSLYLSTLLTIIMPVAVRWNTGLKEALKKTIYLFHGNMGLFLFIQIFLFFWFQLASAYPAVLFPSLFIAFYTLMLTHAIRVSLDLLEDRPIRIKKRSIDLFRYNDRGD